MSSWVKSKENLINKLILEKKLLCIPLVNGVDIRVHIPIQRIFCLVKWIFVFITLGTVTDKNIYMEINCEIDLTFN